MMFSLPKKQIQFMNEFFFLGFSLFNGIEKLDLESQDCSMNDFMIDSFY